MASIDLTNNTTLHNLTDAFTRAMQAGNYDAARRLIDLIEQKLAEDSE